MTPNTTVTLYATPFDISNKYVIAADSPGEALGIVSSYPSKVYTDCYWQRDNDFVFRANGNINEVEQYNYCVYLNNGKYNFAFITECDYVNDAMTLVHLATDPWLNFAGQYVFHNSPMVRAHPPTAEYFTTTPEPIAENPMDYVSYAWAFSNSSVNSLCLMTTVKTTSYSDTSIDDYWDGIAQLFAQNATAIKAYSAAIQGASSVINGIIQPCTSMITNRLDFQRIVKNFVQNGRGVDIVGAYSVPVCMGGESSTNLDIGELLTPQSEPFTVPIHRAGQYNYTHWLKTLYSSQFNLVFVEVCGNVQEIDYNNIPWSIKIDKSGELVFDYFYTLNENGCATVKLSNTISPMGFLYSVSSPQWDKVSIAATYANIDKFRRNALSTISNGIGLASGLISNLMSLDVGGAITEVAESAMKEAYNHQSLAEAQKGDTIILGNSTSTIAGYLYANDNKPVRVLTAGLTSGQQYIVERIFGTYGYMMGGNVIPIEFKKLPHWTYYQTQTASIEGSKVPQRYLMQIIQRFNAGIFIFNSVADYKDFSKALDNHY